MIQCPECEGATVVRRTVKWHGQFAKYRQCKACGFKFRTEHHAGIEAYVPRAVCKDRILRGVAKRSVSRIYEVPPELATDYRTLRLSLSSAEAAGILGLKPKIDNSRA